MTKNLRLIQKLAYRKTFNLYFRFGTKGLGITFVSDEADAKTLNDVQERFEVDITELPDEIDLSTYIEGR
mgnify:CR=1 FL=1